MRPDQQEESLREFIAMYDPNIQEIFLHLRAFILKYYPGANQLIYDGYNTVSVAFSFSKKLNDAFCHLALYKNHVNIGFNRGAELQEPELKLEGSGRLIRHYKVGILENIPEKELTSLLKKAADLSRLNNPELRNKNTPGRMFIMATSGKKVRP